MKLRARKSLKKRRRQLSERATPAERALWNMLRKHQLGGRKFRRQHGIGSYIVDFYCPSESLAVELDGADHNDPARAAYDSERTAFLNEHGVNVIRFENGHVFDQPDVVLAAIAHHFTE